MDYHSFKGISFRAAICKLAWWVAVYYLWQQGNAIIHSRKIKTEEQNVEDIKRDISKAEWRAKVEQLTQSLTEYCVVNGALTLLLCVKSHFRLSVLAAVMLRIYCVVA